MPFILLRLPEFRVCAMEPVQHTKNPEALVEPGPEDTQTQEYSPHLKAVNSSYNNKTLTLKVPEVGLNVKLEFYKKVHKNKSTLKY